MRNKLYRLWSCIACIFVLCVAISSCNNDEKVTTPPIVETSDVTGITDIVAMGGGVITSDGNASITASGLCWSSTNHTPTVDDDTTMLSVSSGNFSSKLKPLVPSTTYYVRAYATNKSGTGYGSVKTFTTGNAAPTAVDVSVEGTAQVLEKLSGKYTYHDAEGDAEGATTFQWYIADDVTGSAEVAIVDATSQTYTLKNADEFKYIRFGVKTKATAGSPLGTEVKSPFVGPIAAEPTTVSFTYNNNTVTYGVIISSVTGRRWLDRNLGAPAVPSSVDDWLNKGDLFQWGRDDDGHQLINRAESTGGTTAVNDPPATELSSSDSPGHSKFIAVLADPFNWRSPENKNLWQGPNGVNNPCPKGWHIPTKDEWLLENLTQQFSKIYGQLKLTSTGQRDVDGTFYSTVGIGEYWTSTVVDGTENSYYISFSDIDSAPSISDYPRSAAYSCRCIKDLN